MTSDLQLSPDELPANYIRVGYSERGFRFLTDPLFRVAGIYLKKPSQIQTLAMIMVLCLFLYAINEFRPRRGLQEADKMATGQLKRQTQKLTPKRGVFRFRGPEELRGSSRERHQERCSLPAQKFGTNLMIQE